MQREHLIPFLGLAEPISAITHLVAALVVIAFGISMRRRSKANGVHPGRRFCLFVYVVTVAGMLMASGFYHSLPTSNPWRDVFWRLDHAAIWIGLIGTFTGVMASWCPIHLRLLLPLWALAITGAICEMLIIDQLPLWVSPLLYIFMGWANLPWLLLVAKHHGRNEALFLLLAGVIASVGGVIDSIQQPRVLRGVLEAHELLHFATSTGGLIFTIMIWRGSDGSRIPDTEDEG